MADRLKLRHWRLLGRAVPGLGLAFGLVYLDRGWFNARPSLLWLAGVAGFAVGLAYLAEARAGFSPPACGDRTGKGRSLSGPILAAVMALAVSLAAGLWLRLEDRGGLIEVGAALLAGYLVRMAAPRRFVGRLFGGVGSFLIHGPLLTAVTYYALTGVWRLNAVIIGLLPGFLAAAAWLARPEPDAAASVSSPAGRDAAGLVHLVLVMTGYFSLAGLLGRNQPGLLILAGLAPLPLALNGSFVLADSRRGPDGALKASARTWQALVWSTLMMVLALVAERILRG